MTPPLGRPPTPPTPRTRREFLAEVAAGAVVAALGPSIAFDLGVRRAAAEEAPARLSFGAFDPVVALLTETPLERLLPTLVERLRGGLDLRTLVAACALANARAFGGEDYVGFHAEMALSPALAMADASPEPLRALPVLKVLHRTVSRLREAGPRDDTLRPFALPAAAPADRSGAGLRDAVRAKDVARAEATLAALAAGSAPAAVLGALLVAVEDDVEVHRVVLPHRAMELLDVTGPEHALTLLRQSVRYCVKAERTPPAAGTAALRDALPRVLDRHGLPGRAPGAAPADDAWVERTARAIFAGTPEEAADVAAAALAAGTAPDAVGEAVVHAACELCLRDEGRTAGEARPDKPVGSVHGDSIGVHAADSASAWRRLARRGDARTAATCLVAGAWQVARDRVARGGDFLAWTPHPRPEALAAVKDDDPEALARALDAAVRDGDQARAAATAARAVEARRPPRPALDRLLAHSVRADGALHAEKFWRTATLEAAEGRPAFRARWAAALARVVASESGRPAPADAEARRLLGV